MNISTHDKNVVNWRQVGLFLGLVFAISWAIDLIIWQTTGYGANLPTMISLQLQMLIPAFVALILERFFYKNRPVYRQNFKERPRWFIYFYFLFTLVYVVLAGLAFALPDQGAVLSAVGAGLATLGLLVLIGVRGFSTKEAFEQAGLRGGRIRDWMLYGAALVLFYALQTALNWAFGMGQPVDIEATSQSLTQGQISAGLFLLLSAFNTVLVGPFLGLLFGFGEEYGWRGYLQSELVKLGRMRGIALLGVIWGVWHYPVILMGHNYPGYPIIGVFLMTLYTILLAFVFGFVMLKTGSIWLVAWLHALNNQTLAFFNTFVYQPENPVFSFGAGIYGIVLGALVVGLILLDPIWRQGRGSSGSQSLEEYPEEAQAEASS